VEWSPSFNRIARPDGDGHVYQVGHPAVDEFLEFVAGRARPNTVHELRCTIGEAIVAVRRAVEDLRPPVSTNSASSRPSLEQATRLGSAATAPALAQRPRATGLS
jgi:hypothetical protein